MIRFLTILGLALVGEIHLDLRLDPRYSEHPGNLPPYFDLALTLRPDGTGVIATGSWTAPSVTTLAPVGWRREGDRIVVDTLALNTSGPQLSIDEMTLDLRERDGSVVRGEGSATGSVHWMLGDVMSSSPFEGDVAAHADTSGPRADLLWWEATMPLPGRLRIHVSEPVPVQALRSVAVRADGKTVEGAIEPIGPILDLAAVAAFTPTDFLPLDAEVTLDLGELADPAGNRALPVAPLRSAPDPGTAVDNLGFERGLEGWLAGGGAESRGAFAGVDPAEGAYQAVVPSGGWLLGRLDVPSDATVLELTVAMLSEGSQLDSGRSGVVLLHGPGSEALVFDAARDAGPGEPCEGCGSYGTRHTPRRVTADLSPYRGRRIFLSIRAEASGYFGMNAYAVVVDDVRIR